VACWTIIGLSIDILSGASALAEDRPNILLAIADDWSFGHAGVYGCQWVQTPNFDRLAEKGLLFRQAFTPNAKCAPSRATVLTGRYSWQLEAAANHVCYFPTKYGSFVERLAADGYFGGYTGKGWGPGVAQDEDGQPRQITGTAYSRRKAQPPASGISAIDYAANFADFLRDVPAGTPWVFWYGALEPHRGYEFGSGIRQGKSLDQIDRVPNCWPDNDVVRNDLLDYAVEVEHFDAHLGRILELLKSTGQWENTLVIVTSDHGMPFPRIKGQAYDASNHVPLAIHWPGGISQSGRQVDDFVSFVDLAPTILDAARIKSIGPIMQPISGRSLLNIFRATASGQIDPERNHVLVGKERHDVGRPHDWGYPIRGIRTEDWLFLQNFEPDRWPAGNPETGYLNCDGSPTKTEILQQRRHGGPSSYWRDCFGKRPSSELYHLPSDPDCLQNLAADPRHGARLNELKAQMVAELTGQSDPRMMNQGKMFDEFPYADPAHARFYERYMAKEQVRAGWVQPSDFEPEPLD
jgi:arylsulfatase A-like enzyme